MLLVFYFLFYFGGGGGAAERFAAPSARFADRAAIISSAVIPFARNFAIEGSIPDSFMSICVWAMYWMYVERVKWIRSGERGECVIGEDKISSLTETFKAIQSIEWYIPDKSMFAVWASAVNCSTLWWTICQIAIFENQCKQERKKEGTREAWTKEDFK